MANKKKVVREIKLYSNTDLVDAIVEDDIGGDGKTIYTIKCPECGTPLNHVPSVDYGVEDGEEGVWFIRICPCGIPCKSFASVVIGQHRAWTKRKPKPTQIVLKNVVKKEKKTVKLKKKLSGNWWED